MITSTREYVPCQLLINLPITKYPRVYINGLYRFISTIYLRFTWLLSSSVCLNNVFLLSLLSVSCSNDSLWFNFPLSYSTCLMEGFSEHRARSVTGLFLEYDSGSFLSFSEKGSILWEDTSSVLKGVQVGYFYDCRDFFRSNRSYTPPHFTSLPLRPGQPFGSWRTFLINSSAIESYPPISPVKKKG